MAAALILDSGAANAQPAPTPAAAERLISAADIRADFDALYQGLQSAHFDLYARRSRADYGRLYRRMRAEIRVPETRAAVARRFQRFAAYGRVAHARIDDNYRAYSAFATNDGRSFPLSLRFRDGRAFVAADKSGGGAVPIGAEVVRIAGRPIRHWVAAAIRHISADTDYMAAALLELDLPMVLWLELGQVDRFQVELHGGRQVQVPARTRQEMSAAAGPERLDLAATDRTARSLPGDIAYLRPGAFYNAEPGAADPYDNSRFRGFIDDAFQQFLAANARALIVDLRDNPGGDSSFSDIMVAWFADRPFRFASAFRIRASPETVAANRRRLEASGGDPAGIAGRFAALYDAAAPGALVDFPIPETPPRAGERFRGRVFVLVNRNSFSNAVAVAATVQDYGFGTILGEETSDLATTLGAMESFTLPRTGISVGYPKAHMVRPNGSHDPRGVVPDIPIETPIIEGSDDPVLQRVLALVRSDRPEE